MTLCLYGPSFEVSVVFSMTREKFVDVVSCVVASISSEVSIVLQQLILSNFAESAAVDAGRE